MSPMNKVSIEIKTNKDLTCGKVVPKNKDNKRLDFAVKLFFTKADWGLFEFRFG